MGYYSSFEVIDTNFELEELHDILEECTRYSFYLYDGVLSTNDTCKWYDCEKDLALITQDYPGKFIEMERIGEESPDIARYMAKDGLVTTITPELIWPDY